MGRAKLKSSRRTAARAADDGSPPGYHLFTNQFTNPHRPAGGHGEDGGAAIIPFQFGAVECIMVSGIERNTMALAKLRSTVCVWPIIIAAILFAFQAMTGCTNYRDPRAEVIVTSNHDDATIYLIPADKELVQPFTHKALKEYNIGSTSSRRGIWVHHGMYWVVLEDRGSWSGAVEFEVRLDYLNKIHVDF
jgi:hypothetical protein